MPTAVRRSIIAVLLLIVVGSIYGLTQLKSGPNVASSQIIESVSPDNGEKTLQQGQITIDLLSGWDAKLSIDQKAIPDDQLIKVKEQGLIKFQPGTGKALEYFPAGQNCAELTYWQTIAPDQTFTKQWCFTSV